MFSNAERFKSLVDEYLKKDAKYQNEIKNFMAFLKDRLLEEKIFDLNVTHIDEYFIYSFDSKIGAVQTLTTHISALKDLFNFLISEDMGIFKPLYAHIDTAGFKDKLSIKLDSTISKSIMDIGLLTSTLSKIDSYIEDRKGSKFKNSSTKNRFLEVMISRIYAKLSLILPLKPTELFEVELKDIMNAEVRIIHYNGIKIKIPNSLRVQIIQTIEFVEKEYVIAYSQNDKIFYFLYEALKKKPSTPAISRSLTRTYKDVNIKEMLKKKASGKKTTYIYPAESYKITAILLMLKNGTNIVTLKKLTGLDMGTLIADYDFKSDSEPIDADSIEINNGINNTEYFMYL